MAPQRQDIDPDVVNAPSRLNLALLPIKHPELQHELAHAPYFKGPCIETIRKIIVDTDRLNEMRDEQASRRLVQTIHKHRAVLAEQVKALSDRLRVEIRGQRIEMDPELQQHYEALETDDPLDIDDGQRGVPDPLNTPEDPTVMERPIFWRTLFFLNDKLYNNVYVKKTASPQPMANLAFLCPLQQRAYLVLRLAIPQKTIPPKEHIVTLTIYAMHVTRCELTQLGLEEQPPVSFGNDVLRQTYDNDSLALIEIGTTAAYISDDADRTSTLVQDLDTATLQKRTLSFQFHHNMIKIELATDYFSRFCSAVIAEIHYDPCKDWIKDSPNARRPR